MIGGIHGDEYSSISIMFKWIKLLKNDAENPYTWHIIPTANPDGLLQKQAQRTNANQVDLNRNFSPAGDYQDNLNYWYNKNASDPRRYPGPEPFSEAESLWLAQYIQQYKPDVIVSVHAPYGIIDFDGVVEAPPEQLGPLHLKLLGTYPGSLGNYAGIQKGIPVITIELPYAGIMPSKSQIKSIWSDLQHWLNTHLSKP